MTNVKISKKGRNYLYVATFTQADVGGGNVLVKFIANNDFWVESLHIGPDSYAAVRLCSARKLGPNDEVLSRYLNSNLDNQTLEIPNIGNSGAGGLSDTTNPDVLHIPNSCKFLVQALSLAQNETLTIACVFRCTGDSPTIDVSGSGGSVSEPTPDLATWV